jgi:taurine dioxygenase
MMMDNLLLVALASVAPLFAAETAALYGAAAPSTLLPHYRRDWNYCTANLCGGASRLGALLDVGDLRELGPAGADKINDAVRAYGVVVIKGQNLTRAEQVKFTGLLGEPVALAKSFYGKDPEPNQPSILRVTNFWANGTWKGTSHKFGDYWHQDGQFWDAPKPVWKSNSESGGIEQASRRWRGGRRDDSNAP